MVTDLSVNLPGISLKNPFIVSSGVLGISANLMLKAFNAGAGAVVSKSIGLLEREGYSGPNIVINDDWVINAMGLPNPGLKESLQEIVEAKTKGAVVIPSIYGFNVKDYVSLSEKIQEVDLNILELNLSCPNVEGTGGEIGQDPRMVSEIVKSVKDRFHGFLIVKLSPNVADIVALGIAAEKAGADALTAINTIKAMAINIEVRRPILSTNIGGVSGPALKPFALRCVYELFQNVTIPIFGCGGILTWEDVVEFVLAGASVVQVGTALLYEDFGLFKKLHVGVKTYLESKGMTNLSELLGNLSI